MSSVEDDPTIRDHDRLLRRIPPWHVLWDENQQSVRISSAALTMHQMVLVCRFPLSPFCHRLA